MHTYPNLTVLAHPLIRHKLTVLRDKDTKTKDFRELVAEIAMLMAYEVTKDLPTEPKPIDTPLERMTGEKVSGKKLALVPVLRAGLGMVDGILRLLPSARVGHVGLYRDHETLQPVPYYFKVPAARDQRDFFVLDPMLATGGSASDACTTLKNSGARSIRFLCIVAAPQGVEKMLADHPDVPIYSAGLDRELNDHGYILPGLGDAGDRIFRNPLMRITFHGAAGEVTGSMHLLEAAGKKILLDCGLFQGRREEARLKNTDFPAGIEKVDAVILSHAHIDHAGRLPLLIRKGYRGPIYCTPATRDLCSFMLADAGHIQEADAAFLQKRGVKDAVPLYTQADAAKVIEQMIQVPYDKPYNLFPGVRFSFSEAGHILGSAGVAIEIDDKGGLRRVVFSGDIGRAGLPIIRDPKAPPGSRTDVLIIESTYAGRIHETPGDAQAMLAGHVSRVAERGGKVFIPAFALGRTQEVLYELHALALEKRIPDIPIFVDSPLAVNATDVFRAHPECFDRGEEMVREVPDLFQFRLVKYVRSVEESKALNSRHGPCIIIAASGMAESGRIRHHLINGLPDHRNMCLLVGFTASYTLGDKLRQGVREVRILGQEVQVRAETQMVAGYSAHGDRNDLSAWTRGLGPTPKKAFVVHGEAGLVAMAGILKDLGVGDVNVPALHQGFDF